MLTMPDWLAAALASAGSADVPDKQAHFDAHISNELNHGVGVVSPDRVHQALAEFADEIASALGSAEEAVKPSKKSAPPVEVKAPESEVKLATETSAVEDQTDDSSAEAAAS